MIDLFQYTYPIVVSSAFLIFYLFFHLKLKKAEKTKLTYIEERDISDAVETESPAGEKGKNLKQHGISSIEDRFSVLRTSLPIILFILWSVIVSIPYIGQIPSVYITIIAAILSVVAGVALRPFLENLFSGVVISFFKSIKIGDTVIIDDHYGLIEKIGLTYSILKRWDWYRIVIPNSKLLQKEIQNLTMHDSYIWAYVKIFVSPRTDLVSLKKISIEEAKNSKYFNSAEDPAFWVMNLEKDCVECWLAAWADDPGLAWELRNELRTNIVMRMHREGIDFQDIKLSVANATDKTINLR